MVGHVTLMPPVGWERKIFAKYFTPFCHMDDDNPYSTNYYPYFTNVLHDMSMFFGFGGTWRYRWRTLSCTDGNCKIIQLSLYNYASKCRQHMQIVSDVWTKAMFKCCPCDLGESYRTFTKCANKMLIILEVLW